MTPPHHGMPMLWTNWMPAMHQADPIQTSSFAAARHAFSTASKAWNNATAAWLLDSDRGKKDGSTIGASSIGDGDGDESDCRSHCFSPSDLFFQIAQFDAVRSENGSGIWDVDGSLDVLDRWVMNWSWYPVRASVAATLRGCMTLRRRIIAGQMCSNCAIESSYWAKEYMSYFGWVKEEATGTAVIFAFSWNQTIIFPVMVPTG